MKIKMLKSTPGALNGGLDVKIFKKGVIYPNSEFPELEGLDEIFLKIKAAEIYETPVEVIRHEKGLSGAPENKRIPVPENKGIKENLKKFPSAIDELDEEKPVKPKRVIKRK